MAEEVKNEAAPVAETKTETPVEAPKSESGVDESVEAKTSEAGSPDSSTEEFKVPKEFKKLVEEIEKMSVLELNELVKVFEKRFGVSAAAVAVAGPAAAGAVAEEKSTFTVELTEGGAQKIAVIKVVKEALGLGLKEAKDMVDGAPSVVKENLKKEEAEELKTKLEGAGAKVTLK